MSITIENSLYLPGRAFEVDDEVHKKNLRAIELWAALPGDFFALLDKGVLPDPSELPVGSLVRVGDNLHFLKSTGWALVV